MIPVPACACFEEGEILSIDADRSNPRRRTPDPCSTAAIAAVVAAADRSTAVVAATSVKRIDPECSCY